MSKSRHTEAQIIAALKQVEAGLTANDWRLGERSVQAHHLRLESQVRRAGSE